MLLVSSSQGKEILSLSKFKVGALPAKVSIDGTFQIKFLQPLEKLALIEELKEIYKCLALPFLIKIPSSLTQPAVCQQFYPFSAIRHPFTNQLPNGYSVRKFINGFVSGELIEKELEYASHEGLGNFDGLLSALKAINKNCPITVCLSAPGYTTNFMLETLRYITSQQTQNVAYWYERTLEASSSIDKQQGELRRMLNHQITRQLLNLTKFCSTIEQDRLHQIFAYHVSQYIDTFEDIEFDCRLSFKFLETIACRFEECGKGELAGVFYYSMINVIEFADRRNLIPFMEIIERSQLLEPETSYNLHLLLAKENNLEQHKLFKQAS